ncbi:MAG TPA: zf-HC2 domain-containing protein [Verrucomicrobiae bacterium]|nr:zf-HC2 domain-containing protein [Verrucomicrobiae bacterium]
MKPCAQNRKLIAWLALNALDAEQTRQLQAHLETCEGCRRYQAEISNVTERLSAAETTSDIDASESFHREVAGKLEAAKPDSLGEILVTYVRGSVMNWRVAFPAIVALVVVSVVVAIWRQPPDVSSSTRVGIETVSGSGADNDLAPTIANYQRVANQSLDKLDALLTRQGNRALPPMPVYTASTLALAKGS